MQTNERRRAMTQEHLGSHLIFLDCAPFNEQGYRVTPEPAITLPLSRFEKRAVTTAT